MAKPNSLGLDFELLESRCLLNGAVFAPSPLGHGVLDAGRPPAHAAGEDMAAPRMDAASSPDYVQAQDLRANYADPAPGHEEIGAPAPHDLSEGPGPARSAHPLPLGGEDASPPQGAPVAQTQAPPSDLSERSANEVYVSTTSTFPIGEPSAPAQEAPVVRSQAPTFSVGFTSQQATLLQTSQPPRNMPVVVEATIAPQLTSILFGGHSGPQVLNGEEDLTGERQSVSPAQAAPGKAPSNTYAQLHEQNAAALPSAAGQTIAKTEPGAPLAFASPKTSQLSGAATASPGQGPQGTNVVQQNGQDHSVHNSAVEVAAGTLRLDELATRLVDVRQPLEHSEFEPDSWSPATLMTNILPFDFSSLESSVKDFFDQIDRFGLKLSENQVNLLFSSSLMVVTAALALEIARRKLQSPSIPRLPCSDFIPYSDYP